MKTQAKQICLLTVDKSCFELTFNIEGSDIMARNLSMVENFIPK